MAGGLLVVHQYHKMMTDACAYGKYMARDVTLVIGLTTLGLDFINTGAAFTQWLALKMLVNP